MKILTTLIIAVGLTAVAHAQLVVANPISDVLDEAMHTADIAKTVEMINNQVQQINALTQQIQADANAFSVPKPLLRIVGADALIDSLTRSGVGQTLGGLRHLRQRRDNANGFYQSVGETCSFPITVESF